MKVDTWGGFVFINMDPNAEPLAKYLEPMPEYIDCFEIETMRFRWYKSIRLPCNWKVACEAFNEGYHVAATHPQLLDMQGDDVTRSFAMGRHGDVRLSDVDSVRWARRARAPTSRCPTICVRDWSRSIRRWRTRSRRSSPRATTKPCVA